MMTLILVEHDNQHIHPSVHHVLAAALAFKQPVTLLVIGNDCQSVADAASALAGVDSVVLVDEACYAHHLAENLSSVVVSMAPSFNTLLAAATTFGKNVLPRIAACLDVAQVSDVIEVVSSDTFKHPIYAGNAIETVRVLDEKKILTLRTTAFPAVTSTQTPCPIKRLSYACHEARTRFIEHVLTTLVRPELTSAKIIVSGGRGLQSAEKFKLIDELADALGAAVGASRAAVDAGFVPNDYQVGQTGKVVAPALYIAVGISGAVQHLAGMKDSKVIVAINKDADAPIFQIATYGLVGDLFEVVPELIKAINNRE